MHRIDVNDLMINIIFMTFRQNRRKATGGWLSSDCLMVQWTGCSSRMLAVLSSKVYQKAVTFLSIQKFTPPLQVLISKPIPVKFKLKWLLLLFVKIFTHTSQICKQVLCRPLKKILKDIEYIDPILSQLHLFEWRLWKTFRVGACKRTI